MFKFSLAALHKVRKREEEKQQKEFAHVANALVEEEGKKEVYQHDIASSMKELENEYRQGHYDASLSLLYYQYGVGRKIAIEEQEEKIRQIKEILEIKRKNMLQAHIKRKVLDNFRERKEEQYEKEQEKLEEKEVGDIISCRYAQQQTGGGRTLNKW